MLVEDREGRLQFIPSTAPEHHFVLPSGEKASVDLTTTYDLWVLRELFANVIEAEEALGLDSDLAARAKAAVARLPEIPIATDGRLMEWPTDWQPSEPDHRHQSHLYGLYPGAEIDPTRTPEWAAAARASLDVRTSGSAPGGWTSAWLVALWARLGESEKAAGVIRHYLSTLVAGNLINCGSGIFQIDANFGMTGGIAELLIQSHTDVIRLLPAVPPEWPDGSFRGLRARGGLSFDVDWSAGKLTRATVTSDHGGTFAVSLAGGEQFPFTLDAGETLELTA
jgi:alpha-L-fucosidase 2